MKVLKKEDIAEWSYKHTCDNCDSLLEVEGKDLRYFYCDGDFRDPGYDYYQTTCAVCDSNFIVPSNKIPKLLQLEAKDRSKRLSTTRYGV